MLPCTAGESAREAAERQSNYLILTTLESKLPPELFSTILTNVRKFDLLTPISLDTRLHEAAQPSQLGWIVERLDIHRPQDLAEPSRQRVPDRHPTSGGRAPQVDAGKRHLNTDSEELENSAKVSEIS